MEMLALKDIIGPVISFIGAGISLIYYRKNYNISKLNADRSIYVDGQKFLIEICKQLISDPLLWCVYDDHPLKPQFEKAGEEVIFQAKLLAFAHMHLNIFEIILNEAPNPDPDDPQNQSNIWINYFHDTLGRSALIRKVLEAPESGKIWSPFMLKQYQKWKKTKK